MRFSGGLKRYARNTGYLFFEKIIRTIVTLAVGTLLIRYLGPKDFGLLSYTLSFVFLFTILSDLGLDAITVRELLKNSAAKNEILGTTFFLKLSGGIVAIGIIFIIVNFYPFDAFLKGLILIVSLRLIFQSFNNIDHYFQSQVLSKYAVCAQLFSLVVGNGLCLLFIRWKAPLIYFVYVAVAEAFVLASSFVFLYRKNQESIFLWKINFELAKNLIKDSWPLFVSGIASAVYMRLDQIILQSLSGPIELGYYAAAVRLSEAFYFIPMILMASLFPAIINAKIKDATLYQNRLQALFSLLLWFAFILAIPTTFLAPFIIEAFYGKEYLPAAGVLAIHIWASVFVFLGVARGKWAVNENLQIYTMGYLIVAALMSVILNFCLIPVWGIKGAAFATVFSQFLATVPLNLISKKTRHIFFLQIRAVNPIYLAKKSILSNE